MAFPFLLQMETARLSIWSVEELSIAYGQPPRFVRAG
jgi:hypothetical protein